MNHINYRVSLDMFDTSSQTTIKAKKGDSACKIHITLTENGKIYSITEGCYATLSAKKSDGNFIYDNCTIEGNTIVYDFTSSIDENGVCQISAHEGIVECEVALYKGNSEQLTSPRFTLVVDGTVYNGEEIVSSSEANALKDLINEANETVDEIETKLKNGEFVGEKGDKGDKGDSGEKGDKGDKGDVGEVNYSLTSNALKGKKSGESVSISDVSPLEHNLSVKVENSESLMVSGKNLFNVHSMTNLGTSIKRNGITATILENGGVRVTGTPEDNTIATSITFLGNKGIILPAGIYSAEPEGIVSGAKIQCFVQARDINGSHLANFNKEAITIAQKFYMDRFLVYIDKGVTEAIDETFYPCIEKNDKCTGYEPYVEPITYSVNADGTVDGVKSSCFGMTFLADTEGVVIEVEYNRDINKALAQLEAALINFGGAEVE